MGSSFGLRTMDGAVLQKADVVYEPPADPDALNPETEAEGEDPPVEGEDDPETAAEPEDTQQREGDDSPEGDGDPGADKRVPYKRFHAKVTQNRELAAQVQRLAEEKADLAARLAEHASRTSEAALESRRREAQPPKPDASEELLKAMEADQPEFAKLLRSMRGEMQGLRSENQTLRGETQKVSRNAQSLAADRMAQELERTVREELVDAKHLDTAEFHRYAGDTISGFIARSDPRMFKPEMAVAYAKDFVRDMKRFNPKPAGSPAGRKTPETPPRQGGTGAGPPNPGQKITAREATLKMIRQFQASQRRGG